MSVNKESVKNVVNFLVKVNKNMSKKDIKNLYEKEVFNKDKSLKSVNNYLRVVKRNLFISNKLENEVKKKNIEMINKSVKSLNINYDDLVNKLKMINSSKKNNLIEKINF